MKHPKICLLISIVLSCSVIGWSQGIQMETGLEESRVDIDSLLEQQHKSLGINVSNYWKYHTGDNLEWSKKTYDDANWETVSISLNLNAISKDVFNGNCWFRQKITVHDSLVNRPLSLLIEHFGASELYIDGNLIQKFGKIGSSSVEEVSQNPGNIPLVIVFKDSTHHEIAIRYSNHRFQDNYDIHNINHAGIKFRFDVQPNYIIRYNTETSSGWGVAIGCMFGLLLALSLIHILLFIFYKENKSNLYYSLFTLFYSIAFLSMVQHIMYSLPANIVLLIGKLSGNAQTLMVFFLITFLYSIFYEKMPKIKWFLIGITLVVFIDEYIFGNTQIGTYISLGATVFYIVEPIRLVIYGLIKKKKGAKIIGIGVLIFLLAIFISFGLSIILKKEFTITGWYNLTFAFIILFSIPISMSIFLAKEFAEINHALKDEKENLELRVIERTEEVVKQKEVIEEAHKEITDSIAYAKRIQSAILPPLRIVKEYLHDSFILYKPKDIVAGDFYWMEHIDGKILFAAADCTGHGVPGALVSVVCNNALNRSVREYNLTDPGKILDKAREIVIQEFEKSDEEVKDGMDIALCSIEKNVLHFAGAHNPLWIIRENEIIETKANKQPIGKYDNLEPYTTHSFELQNGDSIYIFSDGYVDQFGGEKGKKFKAKAFRELLLSIQEKTMEEQKEILDKTFEKWKGSIEQIDDVCVIGVRL